MEPHLHPQPALQPIAENRVSSVDYQVGRGHVVSGTFYLYGADGNRVESTSPAGGTYDYIYDLAGHVITQIDSSGAWDRGEIYAGGMHLATYANYSTSCDNGTVYNNSTVFTHSDWLGTERVRSTVAGTPCTTWTSYPFGEGSSTFNPGPTHFTGKERDPESGLDYFGARYYGSNMGRFMSPDWAAKPQAVPYSDLSNPQSLNLYGYVNNNPLGKADPDGHCGEPQGSPCSGADRGVEDGSLFGGRGSAVDTSYTAQIRSSVDIVDHFPSATYSTPTVITYASNAPEMTPATAAYVEKVVETANIGSINISATTNGEHAPNSNHYNGTAVDINKVDGASVSSASSNPSVAASVSSIQNTANTPAVGVAHENYGPAGLYRDGKPVNNPQLQQQHENHIHLTIPRDTPKNEN